MGGILSAIGNSAPKMEPCSEHKKDVAFKKKGGMQGSFVQIYGYALYDLQRAGLLPGG